jgi:hypothetical protein
MSPPDRRTKRQLELVGVPRSWANGDLVLDSCLLSPPYSALFSPDLKPFQKHHDHVNTVNMLRPFKELCQPLKCDDQIDHTRIHNLGIMRLQGTLNVLG